MSRLRYVDDVLAILDTKKYNIHDNMSLFNNRFPAMEFKYGLEEKLPFLYVLNQGILTNYWRFNIVRKDTHTDS